MTTPTTETAPIVKTLLVPLPIEKAFRLFTDGISDWWPFETHSIGGVRTNAARFDVDAGRLYERTDDGTEHDWADIAAWEPPHRLALGWRVNPEKPRTEVEVRFEREGEATRVRLEHRGWERGSDERTSYDGGWARVLEEYASRAR